MKIALVNMPFGSMYRPSIGISLLQAGLEQRGMDCDTYYFNLLYASMVGVDPYNELVETGGIPQAAFAGEWVFSQSLYGKDNFDEYRAYVDRSFYKRSAERRELFYQLVLKLRAEAEPFMERAMEEAPWADYDVIGFTTVFEQNVASLSLAKRIKERWPEKFIIFGGANCEGEMGRTLLQEFPFLDAVCSGEGDISFMHFIEQLRETRDPAQCRSQGIVLQPRHSSELQMVDETESSPPVHEMDALPYPNYDDYFAQYERYGLLGQEQLPRFLFESSRGCWWGAKSHCRFCGLNGSTLSYRSKSSDRALEELLYLRSRYSRYTHKAAAVDNIIDMQYFRDFLPRIRDMELNLDMFYETKANLTKEQVKLFHEAGFNFIQPGIESMITSVLRLMQKGVSMMQNVQLLKWAKEFNVLPLWNFLYGFPGENEDEYQLVPETVHALTHLDPPGVVAPIRLDRFSPYFNMAEEYGIVNIRPQYAYSLVYQEQSQDALMRLAYHFEFDYATGQNPQSYTGPLLDAVRAWQSEYSKSEFFSVDLGEHLILVDLRPIAGEQNLHTLTGLERMLYLFCDNVRSLKTIEEHLSKQQLPYRHEEIQNILDKFIAQKWMLTEAGVYLSLAIPLGNYTPKYVGLEKLMQISQLTGVM